MNSTLKETRTAAEQHSRLKSLLLLRQYQEEMQMM